MKEEKSRWSLLLSDSRDSLALFREIATLTVLAILIFKSTWLITPLKNMGLALEEAGFTELNIGGLKQDLKILREKAKDTGLNTQQSQESLEKAIAILNQPNPNIKDAISQINLAQNRLGFTKKQIEEIVSVSPSPTQPRNADQWVVVIGADSTIDGAKDEVKTAKSKGFENVRILLRDGWYRTVIGFSSEKEAKDAVPDISNQIREGSYPRNLTTWCEKIIMDKSGEFEECT